VQEQPTELGDFSAGSHWAVAAAYQLVTPKYSGFHFVCCLQLRVEPHPASRPCYLAPQVYPVAAPVALAGALFSYMVTRTMTADPDTK
jgi:hypothetical protein